MSSTTGTGEASRPSGRSGLQISRTNSAAALAIAVVAGVHFQQYVDFMSLVPTVGVLFLLNAAGGAGIAIALLSSDRTLRALAALGGVGLCVGSLVSIIIALSSNFFGYSEPSLRLPIVIAIVAEVVALPLLLLVLRDQSASPGVPGARVSPADA